MLILLYLVKRTPPDKALRRSCYVPSLKENKFDICAKYSTLLCGYRRKTIKNGIGIICDILSIRRIVAAVNLKEIVKFHADGLKQEGILIGEITEVGSINLHIVCRGQELVLQHPVISPVVSR